MVSLVSNHYRINIDFLYLRRAGRVGTEKFPIVSRYSY